MDWFPFLLLAFLSCTPTPTSISTAISYGSLPRRNSTSSLHDYPTSDLGKLWSSRDPGNINYTDGSRIWPVLLRGSTSRRDLPFACGLYCYGECNSFFFAVFLVNTDANNSITNTSSPQVVWSANRNRPIQGYASLQLMAYGELQLTDRIGVVVWSTNTSSKSVAKMDLADTGNLRLLDSRGGAVWQSFDHPTDSVLPGQQLVGKILYANVSATNSSEGQFYLSITNTSFLAQLNFPGKIYYSSASDPKFKDMKDGIILPIEMNKQTKRFMRFEEDGHLRLYQWSEDDHDWKFQENGLNIGECEYPMVCGEYGICSSQVQCSCPAPEGDGPDGGVSYFKQKHPRQPNQGCVESTPLTCNFPEEHTLFRNDNISYFGYAQPADIVGTDMESCKDACLRNCTCKAAFFKRVNASEGDCYLPSIILSLMENQSNYDSTAFIKVQASPAGSRNPLDKAGRLGVIVGVGALAIVILLGIGWLFMLKKNKKKRGDEGVEFQFSHPAGLPARRFSYLELKSATDNFSRMLGEGGFGCVFEGTLSDGMRVAVKLLGYKGQGMKEFVAEVETIGSIHHFNLVRLVGYCAEKLHRLLIYEFMPNGSLEKWIFHGKQNPVLDWPTKSKIILDVAKGLAYLHEDCRHRIIHMDIKPQNILLDDNFNAKVSDFGLSKLVDRDQSQVFTTLRGTPGYLAPEWLSAVITEKVDVYSFGVVVLEMVCGKKSIDCSRSLGSVHLISVLKKAAVENKLMDIVDNENHDMHGYEEEATKILRIAIWCLQGDYNRRPSMSVVVKVLEGLMDVDPELDIEFFTPVPVIARSNSSTSLLPSFLSGPR